VQERLSDGERAALHVYLAELERWNRRVNLTAVPPGQAWQRHIGDSLRLLAAADPAAGSSVADVGAGAGVPGLVFAVLRPDLHVALIEADRRRVGFLVHVAGVLGVRNARMVAERAEDAGRDPALRERFDLAVSRAAAPPAVLCELALPLVRVGGRLLALVGDAVLAAAECAAAAIACGGAEPAAAAEGVLLVEKVAPTPPVYPRRPGVPSRHPLQASP